MSVISFPRRIETRPSRPQSPPVARERVRRRHLSAVWTRSSTPRKSAFVLTAALVISISGSMFVANRQMQIHQLQNQLLQDQSTYAVQIGSLTEKSAPSLIASQAGSLHLVEPVTVTQVPSTSLDVILPLPKFSGYAPVTSRTIR
ncbi:MAG: hypothetical protein ABR963_00525 [Acidimicrobiales bacterium]|jgi:uncharacterized protein HemX